MSATERGGYGRDLGRDAFPSDDVEQTSEITVPSYADVARERFRELVDAEIKDTTDIRFRLFIQAIAMDYLQRTHLEEIMYVPKYVDTPAAATAYFSDEFAEMFDREFTDEFGDLEEVKDAIFHRHSPTRAIKKIETLTERWWMQKQAE